MSKKTVEKGYLPGYHESLPDQLSKDRYGSKLELIEGTDPYEIPKKDWKDDVELWPSVTSYIHINDVMQVVGSVLCKVMQSKIYSFKFKN